MGIAGWRTSGTIINTHTHVALRHVRSHIKVPGNELADWLAEQGRMSGERRVREETESVDRWVRTWLAENMNVNTAGDPTGDG